jgi:uncharacterized membrane protein
MKEGRPVRRSEMRKEDIGLKMIDDRNPLLRKACHGDPVRSFWFRGRPFPLCARCTTLYPSMLIGLSAGIPIVVLLGPTSWMVFAAFCILEAPLVLDGLTQYKGWRRSNNFLRAVTGGLAGSGIGLAVGYIFIRVAFRL